MAGIIIPFLLLSILHKKNEGRNILFPSLGGCSGAKCVSLIYSLVVIKIATNP